MEFEYVHGTHGPLSEIEILTYDGKPQVPEGIEKELGAAFKQMDFDHVKYLTLKERPGL